MISSYPLTIASLLLITGILVIYFNYLSRNPQYTERFSKNQYPTVQELGLDPSAQQYLATALMQFDPVAQRLTRFPPERTLYLVDDTATAWKQRFAAFKQKLVQNFIQECVSFPNTIFLFADDLFSGDVMVIPFEERQLPMEITDPVLLKFFVRWNPPVNSISALVPAGINLQIFLGTTQQPFVVYEGATRAFTIDEPVVKVVVTSTSSTTTSLSSAAA